MLLRFRVGNVAIISDVEKAFLQVHLQKCDRDATRCLWIRDTSKPLDNSNIVAFRFTRVTFGLNCSPFLLAATISEHLDHTEDKEMASLIQDNVYVDNLIMTASTPDEALRRCEAARQIFAEINMNLREFRTNSDEVNQRLPVGKLHQSTQPKVLGLVWDTDADAIVLQCNYPDKPAFTKRTVSEQVATLYDPLGLLTPLTLNTKLFLQSLWKHGYKWDQQLSTDHQDEWKHILSHSQGFRKFIPRKVSDGKTTLPAHLVAFADASKQAMAACVYLVHNGCSELLMAKSKLPSIKDNPTIPKLEINALTMATRLISTVARALQRQIPVKSITIYSDSEIALGWLAASHLDRNTGVLVQNRCKEVRRINEHLQDDGIHVTFGYVNTEINPADCATRGIAKDVFANHLWWNGPAFLLNAQNQWPAAASPQHRTTSEEDTKHEVHQHAVRVSIDVQQTPVQDVVEWNRYSSLAQATSVFSYALRWLSKIVSRLNPDLRDSIREHVPELRKCYNDEFLTVSERQQAFSMLLRNHQKVHVDGKIQPAKNRLVPVTDHSGLIRCRGRLMNSNLSDESKKPILLGPNTPLATLVIKDTHQNFHLGTAHTIAQVRSRYWIPQLRRQVQKIIRRCVPCQRLNNLPYRYPALPDLPSRRVTRSRPFQHVGIDYFGPIATRAEEDQSKAYGIIITCATTRLIHLECVTDMSTIQLLDALRRFFARRGIPETITSDNAPYFVLGDQILRDAASPTTQNSTLAATMATKGIAWQMITPYAPWQGAFYERLIKTIKHSLYKTIGKAILSFERLSTLLTEIEGTLNTRPLTYQEEHWDDRPTLRPIDFIQRDMIITYPMDGIEYETDDPDYHTSEDTLQLRTRQQTEEALRSSCRFTERFWKIWSEEYLTALREQHIRFLANNHGTPKEPTPGTVVLIMDANLPRNTWKMGRITKTHPNKEGIVREVELQLPSKRTIRRPINLLVPLEIDGQDDLDNGSETNNPTSEQQVDEPATLNPTPSRHYNLRRQPPVNYDLLHSGILDTNNTITDQRPSPR